METTMETKETTTYKGLELKYSKKNGVTCLGCVWYFPTLDSLKAYVDTQLKTDRMIVSERGSLMYI